MKMLRNTINIKKMDKLDDSYVKGTPEKRVLMVWELTKEAWSLQGKVNVKQRLQRHITNLIKK